MSKQIRAVGMSFLGHLLFLAGMVVVHRMIVPRYSLPSTYAQAVVFISGAFAALAWPALLLGRMGLVHTWLIFPGGALWWYLRRRKRIAKATPGERSTFSIGLRSAIPIAVLYCSGMLYVYVFPVPVPLIPPEEFFLSGPEVRQLYFESYEEGYRRGMVGGEIALCGFYAEAYNRGALAGYAAGAGEWKAVSPVLIQGRRLGEEAGGA